MAVFNNKPNLDQMQEYLNGNNQGGGQSKSTQWWTIPRGMSSIRILPPWDPTGRIALPVYMHPIEYQGEGMKYKKYKWTCVNRTFGKPCKICDGIHALAESGVDIEKWEASRREFYMNVIVMYDPVYDADIKRGKQPSEAGGVAPGTMVIMRTPKTIYDWVVSQITNPMIGDITNVENGIDVYVEKKGEGLGTAYTATLSPNGRTPIPPEYLEKIEEIYNLDEIFSTGFDEEQINKLVNHLRQSAGFMTNNVPQQVQQMAGYPQQGYVPQTPYNPLNQSPMVNSNVNYPQMQTPTYQTPQVPPMNSQVPPSNLNAGAVPNPYAGGVPQTPQVPPMQTAPQMTQTPAAPQMPQAPTTPTTPAGVSSSDPGRPKCYGQYSPAQVNCVVCPMELQCKKDSGQ